MFRIFGLDIQDISLAEILLKIREAIAVNKQMLIVTANPEILVYSQKSKKYYEILKKAILLPDGIGIVLASLFGRHFIKNGRVRGVDLVQELVKNSANLGYSVYIIGTSSNDILQKATQNFSSTYGKINIIGYDSGPNFDKKAEFPLNNVENDKLLTILQQLKPDVLLVAFGHPKQEFWLDYYLPQLPVKIGIGVGGTFDYLAGVVKSPPLMFKRLGLEWFWRLIIQPARIKRIFTAVIVFPCLFGGYLIKKLFHVEQLDKNG